jgi:hypothetical protein
LKVAELKYGLGVINAEQWRGCQTALQAAIWWATLVASVAARRRQALTQRCVQTEGMGFIAVYNGKSSK